MAVYKIYPEKDTTLYSANPAINTGLDQILEIQNTNNPAEEEPQVSRILIKFPTSVIKNVINNEVGISGSYEGFIKLFIANTYNLPDGYILYINPISQSWDSGTGRYLYNPADTNGSSWINRNTDVGWTTASFNPNTTASFQSNNPGGGVWFTNYISTQSFIIDDNKDINVNITNIIVPLYNDDIDNNGFIIQMQKEYEFNNTSSFSLKYFSKDTHTIYAPQLEIKWDDSSYNTGSLTLLENDNTVITLGNNIGYYNRDTTYQFRVNARPTYPVRQFTTMSVYTLNQALPSSSYYAVQDMNTGEYVIDFDSKYTKVSCDPNGNYFNLYMNGLQPERYYRILIKSSFNDGSTVVYNNNYTFKINK